MCCFRGNALHDQRRTEQRNDNPENTIHKETYKQKGV